MPNTPNVYEQQFEFDDTDPPGYRCAVARIGAAAGGKDQVIKEFEIPPGETLCPYHYGALLCSRSVSGSAFTVTVQLRPGSLR
jgi:hypothetical protein